MNDIQYEISEAFFWARQVGAAALRRKTVRSLLIIIGVIVTASGFVFAAIDPSIHSPLAGIWYALVTLAHVGYGDIVASSPLGRFLSALLILIGIVLFALAAGIFASILVVQDLASLHEDDVVQDGDHASAERKILLELKELNSRMLALESQLSQTRRQVKPRQDRSGSTGT